MADIQCSVSTNKKFAKIILVDEAGADIGEYVATAHDLDIFIQELGRIRASMVPEVNRVLEVNPVFKNVTRETIFHVHRQHMLGKELFLAVRHPGFGWLAFTMDPSHATALAALLKGQVDAISPKIVKPSGVII